jgi:hypothetical protein
MTRIASIGFGLIAYAPRSIQAASFTTEPNARDR